MPTAPSEQRRATSASVAVTATIAPPAGSACISRPRAATSRPRPPATAPRPRAPRRAHRPSGRSRRPVVTPQDSTAGTTPPPARTAPAGRTPCSCQQLRVAAPHHLAQRQPRRWRPARRDASSNACGEHRETPVQLRPIPSRCAPWPVNTNTACPPTGSGRPARPGPAARRPAPPAPPQRSSRSAPTTTARCSKAARVVASEQPTSTGRTPVVGTHADPAVAAPAPASASGDRADTTHGITGRRHRDRFGFAVELGAGPARGSRARWCR